MKTMIATTSDVWLKRAIDFFSFQYTFVVDAFMASILIGAICGLVGTFLVLRQYSLLGDATGHATLPGVCIAFLIAGTKSTGPLLIGALVSGLLGTLSVGLLSRGPRVRSDAAIGIVLSVFFGVGIVLLSFIQNSPTGAQSGLQSFLFGNVAGVSRSDLWVLIVVCGGLASFILGFYRPLKLTIFDEGFARAIGIRTSWIHFGLLASLAISVVISIQAVGVVLVAAMLIIPPSAALLLARRLPAVLLWAVAIGAVSGALGTYFSFIMAGVATGPAMVLVSSVIFFLALGRGTIVGSRRAKLISNQRDDMAIHNATLQEQ